MDGNSLKLSVFPVMMILHTNVLQSQDIGNYSTHFMIIWWHYTMSGLMFLETFGNILEQVRNDSGLPEHLNCFETTKTLLNFTGDLQLYVQSEEHHGRVPV